MHNAPFHRRSTWINQHTSSHQAKSSPASWKPNFTEKSCAPAGGCASREKVPFPGTRDNRATPSFASIHRFRSYYSLWRFFGHSSFEFEYIENRLLSPLKIDGGNFLSGAKKYAQWLGFRSLNPMDMSSFRHGGGLILCRVGIFCGGGNLARILDWKFLFEFVVYECNYFCNCSSAK